MNDIKPVWPDFIAPPKYDNPDPRWVDPALPDFRLIWKVARECGYAVGLHGSMKRDCDLIAVPWTDEAVLAFDLIYRLCETLNAQVLGPVAGKPHGRLGWNIQVDGYVKVIDISVVPRSQDRAAPDPAAMPQAKRCAACGSTVTDLDDHLVHDEECGGEPDEPVAAPNLKRIGTGLYETQPTPDPAAIREAAHNLATQVGFALNDCCILAPHDGNIAALHSALIALIQKGSAEPTEYERKVAQMKKDFPNGI